MPSTQKGLAACVSVSNVTSTYWWHGQIEQSTEQQLVIKTRRVLFQATRRAIETMHPYQVPEVLLIEVDAFSEKFGAWLRTTTSQAKRTHSPNLPPNSGLS
jgi:periplasmic divalent cation tolerance protein